LELFLATLRAIAPLFAIVLLGYGLKRRRLLHAAHVPILNGVVVNVTLPALILRGLATAPSLPLRSALFPLLLAASEVVAIGAAFCLGSVCRMARPTRGALMIGGTFGNTGFLGYPIVLALMPNQLPAAILLDQFGMTVPLYITAALFGTVYGSRSESNLSVLETMRRALRTPLFASVIVGILLHMVLTDHFRPRLVVTGVLIHLVGQCLRYLGQATTGLVLLALGVALRPSAIRAYVWPVAAACMVKLIVAPVVMWGLSRAAGYSGQLLALGILQAGMPAAVMGSVLCGESDMAGDYAVSVVFVSTIFAAATLPVMLAVLR